jgi:hypothetical protein
MMESKVNDDVGFGRICQSAYLVPINVNDFLLNGDFAEKKYD